MIFSYVGHLRKNVIHVCKNMWITICLTILHFGLPCNPNEKIFIVIVVIETQYKLRVYKKLIKLNHIGLNRSSFKNFLTISKFKI